MPLFAIGLLLVAAFFHSGWNLLVKQAQEKQAFTWWALVIGTLCFSPLLIFYPPFPARIWPYLISSAIAEGTYYTILTRAYDYGDFSLVYPMARGTAPAFLALWAIIFLGERPGTAGYIGLVLIICGLVFVGGKSWWSLRKSTALSTSAVALALSVAVCISIYSVIDGAAVHIHLVNPLSFAVAVIGMSTIFFTPGVFWRYGSQTIVSEWRSNKIWIMCAGIFMLLAYMLALQTYSIAQIDYAGAIREVSIVLAAFIGWRWLGEDFGLPRLVGALLIFSGIVVIAIAG
jgi:drug/metabolite transporter (DMT)-like permease